MQDLKIQELKALNPELNIDITNYLCQRTTDRHLNTFDKVVVLHLENELIDVEVTFDIQMLGHNQIKRFTVNYRSIKVEYKHEIFDAFKKSMSISQRRISEHVEFLLNES